MILTDRTGDLLTITLSRPDRANSLTAEMMQALIDKSQEHVSGTVRVKLYKGSVNTVARWSDQSLYSEAHVTFEDDAGAYDQTDAQGFIQLNALRLKLLAARKRRS